MSHVRPTPRRRRAAAAVAVASLAWLAACDGAAPTDEPSASAGSPSGSASGSPSGSESASPSGSPTASGSGSGSGPFDAEAGIPLEGTGVVRVLAGDERVVTLSGLALTVREVPDLEEAYSLEPEQGSLMDVLVDDEAGVGYLLSAVPSAGSGTGVGRDTFTVQRFDLDSGDVTATGSARIPRDSSASVGPALPRLKGVVRRVAVLDVTTGRGTEARHTAVALALGEDRPLWRHRGERVLAVTPQAVVVFRGDATTPGDVAGLVPGTGRQRWAALPATQTISPVGTTDTRVLLARSGPFGILAVSAVDLRTGASRPGRDIETAEFACRPASPTIAVCLLPGREVVGWALQRNRALWSLPTKSRYAPAVTLVGGGRVWGGVGGSWVALDARTGKDEERGPGAAPIAASDAGAVFVVDGQLTWLPRAEPAD